MKELEKVIEGRGEKRGWLLTQIAANGRAYIYECACPETEPHYEVFRRKENSQYQCISYPNSKSFGRFAWTLQTLEQAIEKYNSL